MYVYIVSNNFVISTPKISIKKNWSVQWLSQNCLDLIQILSQSNNLELPIDRIFESLKVIFFIILFKMIKLFS